MDKVHIAILGIIQCAWLTGCASGLPLAPLAPLTITTPALPLTITTSAVANGTVGTAYQQTIQATGGTAPFSWSVSAGTLPAGLSLGSTSSESLLISGLPVTLEASANFSISVTDSKGNAYAQQYMISIAAMTVAGTQSGQVQGIVDGNLVAFRGIPFAAPPTGDLRWRPPTPPPSWQGIRDASMFGSVCPQAGSGGQMMGDEDCLTLNVFESTSPGNWQQPVMLYFHGGGNDSGSAQQPPLDAPPLATHGVIVVTAQYRLGLLGFFANSLLTAEGGGSSGNYALWDQIAALEWVKANISAFGGDPSRVTLFGQSAGAYDVQALLVSPLTQGLFARAAMESGNAVAGGGLESLATLETTDEPFVSSLGCSTAADTLACLRALPAQTIVNKQGSSVFGPAIEPLVVPVDPNTVLQQQGPPVPLLVGSNREESTYWVDTTEPLITSSDYASDVEEQFNPFGSGVAAQVLALYPVSDYATPNYALIAVHSDYQITCQVRKSALAATGTQRPSTWRYLFIHQFENNATLNAMAAYHTAELFFVFGNLQVITTETLSVNYTPSAAEQAFSEQMMDYWAQFAANGDPNGGGSPLWPLYDATDEQLLQLDETVSPLAGYHAAQCNYVAGLPPPF
jgi:para-nitrobenzyl esterase